MAGYFELKRAADGGYVFNLKAGNHETILTSEVYSSKAAAENGIASVRRNAASSRNFQRKIARNGAPFFSLTSASNGQIIGKSEMYSSTRSMEGGIASVTRNAGGAKIKDKSA